MSLYEILKALLSPAVIIILVMGTMVATALGAVIVWRGFASGSHLYRASSHELAFRKPFKKRALAATVGLAVMFLIPLLMAAGQADDPQPMDVGHCLVLLLLGLISFGGGGALFRLSGRDELRLDRDARTYRWIKGCACFSRTRTGPWEDFHGLYVGEVEDVCYVGLRLERPKGALFLGSFERRSAAFQFRDELAALLGLPLVKAPLPLMDVSTLGLERPAQTPEVAIKGEKPCPINMSPARKKVCRSTPATASRRCGPVRIRKACSRVTCPSTNSCSSRRRATTHSAWSSGPASTTSVGRSRP